MKLLLCVVNNEDSNILINRLSADGYWTSASSIAEGVTQAGKVMVLIKADDNAVSDAVGLIKEICPTRTKHVNPLPPVMEPGEIFAPIPVEEEVKGATVFILDVDQFYQF